MNRNLPPPPQKRRKRVFFLSGVAVIVLLSVLLYTQVAQTNPRPIGCALSETGRISLPNVAGRIDHMAFSAGLKLLVVAARNNNSLAIADTTSMKFERSLDSFSLPQWTAFVRGDNALVVTNGGNGTVSVMGTRDFAGLTHVDLASDADNLVVDPATSLLYVGYGTGDASGISAVNTTNWKVLWSVPLIGHPEAMKVEENGTRLFVNVPAGNYVAVLNKTDGRNLANWPIINGTGVFAMTLDEAHNALFVASRSPSKLIMISTLTGAETAELSIPGDADDMFYDASNGCVFVSSGDGYITAVKEVVGKSLQLDQSLQTYQGGRTSLLDAKSGLYFLAVPASQNASAIVIVYRVGG